MVFSNFNTTLMGVGHAEPTALMAEPLFENAYKRSYQPPLSPNLGGYPQTPGRGAKPSDIKALEELLLRVSAMVEDFPQIRKMDLNPLKSLERGYAVVDARIMLS
jgi:hypothetical protein